MNSEVQNVPTETVEGNQEPVVPDNVETPAVSTDKVDGSVEQPEPETSEVVNQEESESKTQDNEEEAVVEPCVQTEDLSVSQADDKGKEEEVEEEKQSDNVEEVQEEKQSDNVEEEKSDVQETADVTKPEQEEEEQQQSTEEGTIRAIIATSAAFGICNIVQNRG